MGKSNDNEVTNIKRAARVGSAAAITMVGGTIFVDGQPVSAATFEVDTLAFGGAGSLFQAVQDANAAPGPDTITFAAGLTGEINIGATTLRVSDDLTITGPGADALAVTNMRTSANNLIYLYNEASLTISGLTLDDAAEDAIATSPVDLVAPAVHAGDISLTDVVINDAFDDGIDVEHVGEVTLLNTVVWSSGGIGVEVAKSEDVSVTNSQFVDSSDDDGADFEEVDGNVAVVESTFADNGEEGLDIGEVTGSVVIDESSFDRNYDQGLTVREADDDVTITDTTISNTTDEDGLYIDNVGGDVLIERVTVTNSGEYGTEISDVAGTVTLRDVTVDVAYDSGIDIERTDGDVLLERVTVNDTIDYGIYINGSGADVTLRDVTLRDAGREADGIQIDATAGDVLVERVDVSGAYENGLYVGTTSGSVTVRDVTVEGGAEDNSLYIHATTGPVLVERVTLNGVYDGLMVDESDDDVTIREVTVNTSFNYGIYVSDSYADVLIEDVTVTNTFDGQGVFVDATGEVTIRRATITNTGDHGLGVWDAGGGLVIEDVTIDRSGESGLYLYNISGTATVENVTIDRSYDSGILINGASTYVGPGVYSFSDGDITIADTTITNSGGDGMELYLHEGDITLRNVTIRQADDTGLQMSRLGGSVVVDRSTIAEADAGGILVREASGTDPDELPPGVYSLEIVNSTISGNRDDDMYAYGGAAMNLFETDATVRHSTLADNDGNLYSTGPDVDGFAVFLRDNSTLTVDHSIVAANNSLDSFGDDGSTTLTVTDSIVDVGTGLGGSTIEADPELGPLQDNGGPTPTMKPLPGSPAIDGGDAGIAGEPATDQRGVPRKNGVIDVGAVEITAGVVSVGTPNVTVAEDAGTADVTLTRTGGQDGAATVEFDTADGTATAGLDFTAVSDTVTFADNQVSATVSVPVLTDAEVEGDETFTATISSPTTVTLGAPTSATVTITDTTVPVPASSAITPLAEPQRFADTRAVGETIDDISEKTGKLAAGEEIEVQITGRGGVPADAVGVVMNITAINAEGIGFITAHGCVTPRPLASSLNYTAGVNLGNEVVAGLSADGSVCLYTSTATDLAVDVVGYISASSPLENVTPARLLDTRPTGETIDDVAEGGGPLAAGSQTTLQVGGRAGVPADAAAVIVNVTAINPTGIGFVTVHPCVDPRPLASSLNYVAGVNRGNELIASLNADGELCIYTSTETQLAVDVVGYLPAGTNLNSVTPARLLDSRPGESTVDGTSAGVGKFAAGEEYTLQVGGRAGVPATATAAIVNVTAIQAEAAGFVTVHPCVDPRPLASSLNYVPGVNGGNEIVASLNADGELCLYTFAAAHLAVDVVGYLE